MPNGENVPFPWRRLLFAFIAVASATTASHLLVGWYNGRGLRPLALAGIVFWITTAVTLGLRRHWLNQRQPELTGRRWKFSTVDLLILVTGLTLFVGFSATEHLESKRLQREQKQLQAQAADVLGPDGRIGFESDGSVTISICDRSFDDDRLGTLAQMIEDWNQDAGVSRLSFGTGMKTGGTPPVWPGVTDRSVDLLLKWDELEWLSVDGAAISDDGHKRLRTLPRLNDLSRRGLETKDKP